jgi:hypothetical protein
MEVAEPKGKKDPSPYILITTTIAEIRGIRR